MTSPIKKLFVTAFVIVATLPAAAAPVEMGGGPPVPVTVMTFGRAESDKYFADTVKLGGFGKFFHYRTPTPTAALSTGATSTPSPSIHCAVSCATLASSG